MTDRPIWDISPPIRTGIPVWPGDTSYSEARTWAIGPECPVNVSKFTMSTHTGSHADAPGSGLGLAIVERIAERHDAQVTLADGPGGRGLEAVVRFAGATVSR